MRNVTVFGRVAVINYKNSSLVTSSVPIMSSTLFTKTFPLNSRNIIIQIPMEQ